MKFVYKRSSIRTYDDILIKRLLCMIKKGYMLHNCSDNDNSMIRLLSNNTNIDNSVHYYN